LQLNNATASETIMIGYSYEADIVGAQNAGAEQIYFNPTMNQVEKDKAATYFVKSLEEIIKLI